jgi:oxygen-independent coproporphyrinogen-3 oxidase
MVLSESPPLALYVHIPWCLQKCPYCDFNSHAVPGELNEAAYIDALLRDLDADLSLIADRGLISIFIGGGTPSLLSAVSINRLLPEIAKRLRFVPDIEISIEANPGAVDSEHFRAYRKAGVNRLSIGAQSFTLEQLQALGRIHGPEEIIQAVDAARAAGFDNLNLDIMYGLPGQTLEAALEDVIKAISLQPEHISFYQLTIEPNTSFHAAPPVIPEDELLWNIETKGRELLDRAGYRQYEVSAFARKAYECRHNRNYWEFGDYLGIGAGAHGKISVLGQGQILRTRKPKSPDRYLQYSNKPNPQIEHVKVTDLPLEFMLNALRLKQGFHPGLFQRRTGLETSEIETELERAKSKGLLEYSEELICPTAKGREFLNELLALFMPGN